MLLIKNGLVFGAERKFEKNDIRVVDGSIDCIGRQLSGNPAEIIDAENFCVVPGFIDLHTHGANGIEFMTASASEINSVSVFLASKGVTAFLPTTVTAPVIKIVEALQNIKMMIETGTSGAKIIGINLEGPFMNRKYKGGHPEEYIIFPTAGMLQSLMERSGSNLKIVNLAPELEGAAAVLEYFRNSGIVFSLAHSDVNYYQAQQAFGEGISHVTHLYNAMTGIHHREPGLAGAAIDNENVTVEIIADCIHVHPPVIRMTIKCKTPDKVALITDSTMAAGLKDGTYTLGGQQIIVRDGAVRLASGVLSGSVLTMVEAVRNMVRIVNIPLEDAIVMASSTPAAVLGLQNKKGSLKEGLDADIVLLDKDLNVKMTIVEGRIVYKAV